MGGAVWFGGTIVFAFAVWPAMLRKPAAESKATFDILAPAVGVVFAIAANLTLWLGLLRGTLLGPIQSLETLTKTAYGHTFMTALVLTVAFMIYSGRARASWEKRVWNGDQYHPGAASFIWRSNLIGVVLLIAIVACMVAMRFGL
jgi:putative copper export protein